jgi:hypothetical protein
MGEKLGLQFEGWNKDSGVSDNEVLAKIFYQDV